ncbi:hypothetical protein [Bradyrhizobium sp. Ash2021]|uniref:hypothetical protein n=1 Tax=Bradyrhizobium sp. Ash2021 TaxID=2954771 RepID=UPI002816255E|nr:hypothetical protein [Bradyrhizobium sp. Ash2021]WMT77455.1 hypothetical protein NL528_14345 [Bradyrhizobium sp. Ash2021]
MTAFAGGGQTLATQISRTFSRFTVVATTGDSAVLPGAGPGLEYTIKNAAANSMNVFPAAASQGGFKGDGANFPAGDAVNTLGANVAFALGAGKSVRFFCVVLGIWDTLPTIP